MDSQPGPSKVNNKPIAEWPVRARTPVTKTPETLQFPANLILPPSLSLVPIIPAPPPSLLKTPSITFTRYDKPRPQSASSTVTSAAKPIMKAVALPIKPSITLTPITRIEKIENPNIRIQKHVDTTDAVHKRLDPSADTVLSLLPSSMATNNENKNKREILGKLPKNLLPNGSSSGTMARVMQNPNLSISISEATNGPKAGNRVIPSPSLTVTDVLTKTVISESKDRSLSAPAQPEIKTTRSRRCVKKSAKVLENEQTAALLAHDDSDQETKARNERDPTFKIKKKTVEFLKKNDLPIPVPIPSPKEEKKPLPVALPSPQPSQSPPPPAPAPIEPVQAVPPLQFIITQIPSTKLPIYVSKIVEPVTVPEPDVSLLRVPRSLPPLPPLLLKRYDEEASDDSSEVSEEIADRDLVDHRVQTRSTLAVKRKKSSAKKKKGKKKKRFSFEEDLSIDPRFGGKSITEKVKEKVKSGRDRRGEAPPPAPIRGPRGRVLRGPYVHIEGRWLTPRKVDIVNGSEKEESNLFQVLRPTWPYVDAEHRQKAGKVGYTSTLSEKYDSTNRDASWVCVFCQQWTHLSRLGDLFGPYYVRKLKPMLKDEKGACPIREEEEEDYGKELEVWFHETCVIWASEVVLVGPRLKGLDEAVADASISDCSVCGKKGANLICRHRHCGLRSHYPCAVSRDWLLDEEKFNVLCHAHVAPPLPEMNADTLSGTKNEVRKQEKELERSGGMTMEEKEDTASGASKSEGE